MSVALAASARNDHATPGMIERDKSRRYACRVCSEGNESSHSASFERCGAGRSFQRADRDRDPSWSGQLRSPSGDVEVVLAVADVAERLGVAGVEQVCEHLQDLEGGVEEPGAGHQHRRRVPGVAGEVIGDGVFVQARRRGGPRADVVGEGHARQ
jgi:hypothetical protein